MMNCVFFSGRGGSDAHTTSSRTKHIYALSVFGPQATPVGPSTEQLGQASFPAPEVQAKKLQPLPPQSMPKSLLIQSHLQQSPLSSSLVVMNSL